MLAAYLPQVINRPLLAEHQRCQCSDKCLHRDVFHLSLLPQLKASRSLSEPFHHLFPATSGQLLGVQCLVLGNGLCNAALPLASSPPSEELPYRCHMLDLFRGFERFPPPPISKKRSFSCGKSTTLKKIHPSAIKAFWPLINVSTLSRIPKFK